MFREKKNVLLITLVMVFSLYICGVKLTNGKVEYLGDNLKVLNENEDIYFDEIISKTVMDDNHTFDMTLIKPINVEKTYNGSLITWPSVNDSQGHQITYSLYYTKASVMTGEEHVYTHIANTTDNNYLCNTNSLKRDLLIIIRIEAKCEYGLTNWGISSPFTISDAVHTLTFPRIHLPIKFIKQNASATLEWDEAIDSYGSPVFYEVYFSVSSQIEWILIETNITRTSFTINLTKISNGEYNNNDPPEISEDTGYYLRVSAISKISAHSTTDFPDEMKEFITSEIEKNQKLEQEQEITPGWSTIITIFSVVIVIIISRIINIQNRRKIN